MLAIIAASVLAALSGQSYPRPPPTVVELCNDTPARVTWSVTRPTGRPPRTQRGCGSRLSPASAAKAV